MSTPQVMVMVGIAPVADALGRVNKLEVVPLEQLGRPRVDVVVNCSGVFRDLFVNQVCSSPRARRRVCAAPCSPAGPSSPCSGVAGSCVGAEPTLCPWLHGCTLPLSPLASRDPSILVATVQSTGREQAPALHHDQGESGSSEAEC